MNCLLLVTLKYPSSTFWDLPVLLLRHMDRAAPGAQRVSTESKKYTVPLCRKTAQAHNSRQTLISLQETTQLLKHLCHQLLLISLMLQCHLCLCSDMSDGGTSVIQTARFEVELFFLNFLFRSSLWPLLSETLRFSTLRAWDSPQLPIQQHQKDGPHQGGKIQVLQKLLIQEICLFLL